MRTFDGWRAVGRAMWWARSQDRVTFERTRTEEPSKIFFTWTAGEESVYVDFVPGGDPADLTFEAMDASINRAQFDNAATALRVLAALDLIPAELAEVHDERYGRCETCGRVLAWHSDRPGLLDGWSHVDQKAWVAQGPHRAAVAE